MLPESIRVVTPASRKSVSAGPAGIPVSPDNILISSVALSPARAARFTVFLVNVIYSLKRIYFTKH